MSRIEITRIQRAVTEHFGLAVEQLLGHSRAQEFVIARHIAMYLEREVEEKPFALIGKQYLRDHSSVMAACNHVAERVAMDDQRYASHVKKLTHQLDIHTLSEQAAKQREHRAEIYCPTCGSAVIVEMKRQLEELREQIKMLKGERHA